MLRARKQDSNPAHSFGNRQGAVADSRNGAGNGSRLYEVNIWLWSYCSGQPHWVTVAKAELQRKAGISDARTRAADTLKRRKDRRGEDYYRQQAQDASDGSATALESQCCYIACYLLCYISHAVLNAI